MLIFRITNRVVLIFSHFYWNSLDEIYETNKLQQILWCKSDVFVGDSQWCELNEQMGQYVIS